MARISTYDLDSKVTGGDKWIGTDSGSFNKTKNFTPIRLAEYFNSSEKIDSTNSLRFYYQIPEFEEERAVGTISFESFLGLSIPLSDLSYILLSKTTEGGIEVPDFLSSLIDSKVLLHKGDSMNVYGIYEITSIEDYEINSNFFKISFSFIRGNGNLANGSSYLLSVIDFGLEQDITKHSELTLDDGTNPHGTTKSDVGLSNVDNTSDVDKPISTATQQALDLKANASDLGDVAVSNDYHDLDNLPPIPNNLEELHNVTETNYTTPIDTDSVLTFDVNNSLWKRLSWVNIKSKLKSYFDTLYLSLSIFNDFETAVFDSLDNKLDKSSTPSSVYTTDAEGLQVMKPISEFQPVGDYVTVNTTQTVTGNKTFNDVGLIKKVPTNVYPNQSGGNFYIGDDGGYDRFEFYSFDGTDGNNFGSTLILSNSEDGNLIRHTSIDGQIASILNINQYNTYLRHQYGGQNTSIYVNGQTDKIIIEGTTNKYANLGTSLITGTKNFEFPNNSGTLALLSDLSGFTTPSEVATQITTAINSNKTSFTHDILVSNWTLVSGKYEAVISNVGILANSFVDVIPSNDHVDIVRNAQIYPSVLISAGSVKVYSKYLPSDTITVTININ